MRRKLDNRTRKVEESGSTLDSPLLTFKRLYLDRSLAFIFLVVWLVLSPLIVHVSPAAWLLVLLLLGVFFIAGFTEGNRYEHTVSHKCRTGAEDAIRSMGVGTVILGHTHVPEETLLGGGVGRYLNAGSFMAPTMEGSPYVRIAENGSECRAELLFFGDGA